MITRAHVTYHTATYISAMGAGRTSNIKSQVPRTYSTRWLRAVKALFTHHGAQPRGNIARNSSAGPGLPWSYILAEGVGPLLRLTKVLFKEN
ncbi:hypothetical protein PoB_003894700 [Plakobranchus ocellatus]|uniref:Uncharacterized protein n=1 Tax=Plakobranchus ocellatus TaxID=259542 RepID=A0AAV4AYS0_9GAST|nr:hypothetical protein PoB_003894700 [Plakobranchus ocellatus]